MQADLEDVLSRRRTAAAAGGTAFLGDPNSDASLKFKREGDVISDEASDIHLSYYFPSALGYAHFYFGQFEAGEIAVCEQLLKRTKHPVVLDVGANIGSHSIVWATHFPNATIFAFEPSKKALKLLRHNVKSGPYANVTIVEQAVSSRAGQMRFFEASDEAYSGLHNTKRQPIIDEYPVETTTIDGFVRENGLKTVTLLKIDVEGSEDAILDGAQNTLERLTPAVMMEIFGGTDSNLNPAATIARMQQWGYEPYVILDGLLQRLTSHSDAFYNYLFLPKNQAPPQIDLETVKKLVADRIVLEGMLRADLETAHKAAEQLRGEATSTVSQLQQKDHEISTLSATTFELQKQLREKDARIMEISREAQTMRQQLDEKDRLIAELAGQDAALHEQLEEKDRLIADLAGQDAALHEQLEEKQRLIEQLASQGSEMTAQLEEKERLIDALAKQISSEGDNQPEENRGATISPISITGT